jgi:predicted O-methyltransferase YrrM
MMRGMVFNGRVFTGEFCAFSPADQVALDRVLSAVVRRGMRVAEVGSWLGNGSTLTLLNHVQPAGGTLYCIDTWQGSPNVARHQMLAADFDPFSTFLNNVANHGGRRCVCPLVMSSLDAATIVADAAFDMVFLDASHALADVSADLAAWMPKVRAGGVLCGHDCEVRAITEDLVALCAAHPEADAIPYPIDAFGQIHPGVSLAVSQRFGRAVHLWAEDVVTLANGAQGVSSVWDLQILP